MAYFVKHKDGSELFKSETATSIKEALQEAVKGGAYLGGAYLGGADLGGADLGGAYLGGAYLRGAYLRGADFRGAYLRGADLRGADLRGAHLRGAYLRGAYLGEQWVIQGPARSDGYFFFLQHLKDDKEPMIRAGCHNLSLPDAMKHWEETRGGTPLGAETFAIIDCMVQLATIRGYIKP